jgi:hypothetical protein
VPPGRLRGRETSGRPSALKNYLIRFPPAHADSARCDLSALRSIRFFCSILAGPLHPPPPALVTPCDLVLLDIGQPTDSGSGVCVRLPDGLGFIFKGEFDLAEVTIPRTLALRDGKFLLMPSACCADIGWRRAATLARRGGRPGCLQRPYNSLTIFY